MGTDDHAAKGPTRGGKSRKSKDPFAADPLAEADALDPSALPDVDDPFVKSAKPKSSKATRRRSSKRDPFADDPLADADALDVEALPDVGKDPFAKRKRSKPPKDATPKDATPKDAAPKDAKPKDAKPKDATPKDAKPKDAKLKDAKLKDAKPKDAKPKDATPKDAKPKDATPKVTVSPKAEADDEAADPTEDGPASDAAEGADEVARAPRARRRGGTRRFEDTDPELPALVEPPSAPDSERIAPQPPPGVRKRNPLVPVLGGLAVLVLGGALIYWPLQQKLREWRVEQSRNGFFTLLANAETLEERVRAVEALPEGAELDPQIAETIEAVRAEQRRAKQRARAEGLFAELEQTSGIDARIGVCRRAISLDGSFDLAYVELGRMLWVKDRGQADPATVELVELRRPALNQFDIALDKDPESAAAHQARAELLLHTTPEDAVARGEAKTHLERVKELDLGGALGALALGQLRLLGGETRSAIELFERALERDPDLIAAHVLRGEAQLLRGEAGLAVKDALAALKLDPRHVDALTLNAEARYRSGRARRPALQDLETVLGIEPAHPKALALRAHLLLRRDESGGLLPGQDVTPARRDAQTALRLGVSGLSQLTLAEIAWSEGDVKGATQLVDQALERPGGHHALTRLLRAQIRFQAGELDAAFEDLLAVLALQPRTPRAISLVGRILQTRGQPRLAGEWLDRAIALDGNHLESRLARAQHALDARPRDLEQALDDAQRAAQLAPQAPRPRLLVAIALHLRGEHPDALEALAAAAERAKRDDPPAWELARWRGHCHYALGQWAAAKQAYTQHLAEAPEPQREARCERRLVQVRRALGELPRVY